MKNLILFFEAPCFIFRGSKNYYLKRLKVHPKRKLITNSTKPNPLIMSVSYSIYEVPDLQGKNQAKTHQGRVNSAGTIETDFLCKMISERSTLSSADVKATLDSLNFFFQLYLSNGYSIRLDDLGIFSLGLKSKKTEDTEKGDALVTKVNTIHFRPSIKLKEQIRNFKLKHKVKKKNKELTHEERIDRIMDHIEQHRFIDRKTCSRLNHVTSYRASEDLQLLVLTKELEAVGQRNSRVYIRVEAPNTNRT